MRDFSTVQKMKAKTKARSLKIFAMFALQKSETVSVDSFGLILDCGYQGVYQKKKNGSKEEDIFVVQFVTAKLFRKAQERGEKGQRWEERFRV